jgi:MFS family permease
MNKRPAAEPSATDQGHPDNAAAAAHLDAWTPLRHPAFRTIWLASLASNVGVWMNELAAAWVMTTMTADATLVALIRTAATLPCLLLALPSGAIADIVNRKRWFMAVQFWTAGVSFVLAVTSWMGVLSPWLLLALVFAYGTDLALRWPVYAAILPEVVPRGELPQAVALNGVAANAARIIGPVIAGLLLASAGSTFVFGLNALLAVIAAVLIWRWRPPEYVRPLPVERFFSAMRVGIRYATRSPPLVNVLVLTFASFIHTSALLALLPLLVKRLHGTELTYSLFMCAMSVGAISAAACMPRLRERIPGNARIRCATVVYAAATVVIAFAPHPAIAVSALVLAGAAWITIANVVTISAQLVLPDWVRARGMSLHLMAVMGGYAAGALLWGFLAERLGVPASLCLASCFGLISIVLTRWVNVTERASEGLTPAEPSGEWGLPPDAAPEAGPVVVSIRYRIAPDDVEEFVGLMAERRRSRMRSGALSWSLFRDAQDQECFIESFADQNWTEHLRRLHRLTSADAQLREECRALHRGGTSPVVTRQVSVAVSR